MKQIIALCLLVVIVGCAPTMVRRTIVTTTHGDGSKGDTVDTKEIIQNRSEMKTQAIDDVLNMP